MWMMFPFAKDCIKDYLFGHNYIWTMMATINVAWGLVFYLLWNYDMYTVAPMPLLRLGEFLIGCGAAVALRTNADPVFLGRRYYWVPKAVAIFLFVLQTSYHGITSICLQQDASHDDCSLWRARHSEWLDVRPPCMTIFDRILNKYALASACLLYGTARAELSGDSGWASRILQADLFKFLSSYSLTLYLAHFSMATAIRWLAKTLLGWQAHRWHDDSLLFCTYLACYGLHQALVCGLSWGRPVQPANDPDAEPLISDASRGKTSQLA
jgi:hypothetical protein